METFNARSSLKGKGKAVDHPTLGRDPFVTHKQMNSESDGAKSIMFPILKLRVMI